jgi:Rrf2 family protein
MALFRLAEEHNSGNSLLASEIAREEQIPKKFLELILLELRNKGILNSKKGKGGGYFLAKAPSLISVGSIIRIFQGSLSLLPCLSHTAYQKCDECISENACKVRIALKEVNEVTRNILDGTSLQEVIDRSKAGSEESMYFI